MKLGWTFHGSIVSARERKKEKRVSWASEHITDDFADVVGTDESMIQQENHRTFCYRKRGTAPKAKSCHFV